MRHGGTVVGRVRERALLSQSLAEALNGRGRVVLLTGEGGMGKTTLAEELAAAATAAGARVARGHGWEGLGSPPMVVWREVLAALGEPDSGAGPLHPDRIRSALLAAREPLLVLLEDLHAADADSARVVAHLSSRLRHHPVLVLATLREDELQARPGAADALASVSADCRRVAVPPLTPEGVAELATLLLGATAPPDLVEAVVRRSDGNAFFVRELVEAQGTELPPGLSVAVQRRVARLPAEVLQALQVAACHGRQVDVRILAAATGRTVPATLDLLGTAVTPGLLEDAGHGRLRFRHALVAEVLQATLPPAQRALHHVRLAEAVQAVPPVHAVSVAHHLVQAAPLAALADVVDWSVRAADEAEAAGAPLEAVRHLRQALDLTSGQVPRARLHERTGHCLFSAGTHTGAAVQAFERALEGYQRAGESRRCGIVHSRLGSHLSLYRHTSDFARATHHFAAAEQLLPEQLDRAHLLVGTSTLHLLSGRPRNALADAVTAERTAAQAGRPALAATGRLMTGAGLLALGRLREGFAAIDASFSTGVVLRPVVDVQAAWHGIVAGVALEDPPLALAYAARGERALAGVRLPGQAQIISDLLAPAYALAGDVTRARDSLAEEDLLGFEVQRDGTIPAYAGQWSTTVPVLERMFDRDLLAGQGVRVAGICVLLGWMLRLGGELDRARGHLERGLAEADRDGRALDAFRLRLELVQVDLAAGRTTEAQRLLTPCRELAAREDLRGLGLRHEMVEAAVVGSGLHRLVADADRRGLPFLALEAVHQWRRTAPERAAGLTRELAQRLEALGLRGTGWDVLIDAPQVVEGRARVLRRDGEVWVVEGGPARLVLRDSKGLRHLARLLASPGREWLAIDLATGPSSSPGASAQPLIDPAARRAYAARLQQLRELADDATDRGDDEGVARADAERQALTDHLAAGTGLGGRDRGWSGPAERARQSVAKTLSSAVLRIAEQDPVLAGHLRAALQTGQYCSYRPDPSSPVSWRVEQPSD